MCRRVVEREQHNTDHGIRDDEHRGNRRFPSPAFAVRTKHRSLFNDAVESVQRRVLQPKPLRTAGRVPRGRTQCVRFGGSLGHDQRDGRVVVSGGEFRRGPGNAGRDVRTRARTRVSTVLVQQFVPVGVARTLVIANRQRRWCDGGARVGLVSVPEQMRSVPHTEDHGHVHLAGRRWQQLR